MQSVIHYPTLINLTKNSLFAISKSSNLFIYLANDAQQSFPPLPVHF